MTKAIADQPPTHLGIQQGGRPSYRASGILAAAVLITLVVLDTLSPPGPPLTTLIGIIVYAAKTAIGMLIVAFGLWALLTTRLPLVFRLATLFYALIVISWFITWIVFRTSGGGALNDSALTYLLNPTFSVWSWLMILMVPLVARLNNNGQLTNAIGHIPLSLGMIMMLIPALGIGLLGLNLNASNAAVAMLFIIACRPTITVYSRARSLILSLIVCAAMIIAGYRIYAAGAILFVINSFLPKSRWFLIFELIAISFIPVMFQYVLANYSDVIYAHNTTSFTDTRSFLFKELTDDLSANEMLVGRGIDARYYSQYFFNIAKYNSSAVGYNNIWRTSSEIAWLNIILHYGVLALSPFYIAVIVPAFAKSRRLIENIPLEGIYCFLPVMMLLFAGELWNAISASYFCWYAALGAMLTARPSIASYVSSPPSMRQAASQRENNELWSKNQVTPP